MHSWAALAPDPQMTPVRARRGKLVHATSLLTPRRTACGRKCDGWAVASSERVGCSACKLAMFGRLHIRRGGRLA